MAPHEWYGGTSEQQYGARYASFPATSTSTSQATTNLYPATTSTYSYPAQTATPRTKAQDIIIKPRRNVRFPSFPKRIIFCFVSWNGESGSCVGPTTISTNPSTTAIYIPELSRSLTIIYAMRRKRKVKCMEKRNEIICPTINVKKKVG